MTPAVEVIVHFHREGSHFSLPRHPVACGIVQARSLAPFGCQSDDSASIGEVEIEKRIDAKTKK